MTKIKFPSVNHSKHNMLEYNQIDDYIFIGTDMCCQTHFDKDLIKMGIKADISLEDERIDRAEGAKIFCWIPVEDGAAPSQEQLQTGVDLITSLVKQKIKMYVHCRNGHGRAPTMVAAYYVSAGLSVEEAIKKIQKKRPVVHLEGNQVDSLEVFKSSMSSRAKRSDSEV